MHETLSLKKSLRQALETYKIKRPNLSIRAIAKKSGVNRYFLNKLLDISDTNPSLDLNQVLILIKYISGEKSISDAIDSSSKDVKKALSRVFSIDYQQKNKVIHSHIYDKVDLNNKTVYFVLVLATYRFGTKRLYIQKILGERGEKVLDHLLKDEILVEENDRIKLKHGTDFTYDFEIMVKRIPDYLDYYDHNRNGSGENYIHIVSEGISKEALREIRKIHYSAYKQISKIISNEENLGDIPFFSFACMDKLSDSIE